MRLNKVVPLINPITEREIKTQLNSIRSSVHTLRQIKFTFKEMENRMSNFGLFVESVNDNVDWLFDSMEEEAK